MVTQENETAEQRRATGSWALFTWAAIAAAQIALAFAASSGAHEEGVYGYGLFLGGALLYGTVALLTVAVASTLGQPRQTLGLVRPTAHWVRSAILVAAGALAVSAALEPVLKAGEAQGLLPDSWQPGRAAPFFLNLSLIVLAGPFVEELFYRGLGQGVLERASRPAAWVLPAGAWALAHGILVALPPLLLFGLALAWLRDRTESLWPVVVAHALYNALGVALAFV